MSILIVGQKDLFEQFRSGVELEACYSRLLTRQFEEDAKKRADPVADLFAAVELCSKSISNVPYKAMKDPMTKGKILEVLTKLEQAITDIKS